MIITTDQLKKIITAGGSLVLDASSMPNSQIVDIAGALSGSQGTLTLKNVQNMTNDHMRQIAAMAPGKITFDLT